MGLLSKPKINIPKPPKISVPKIPAPKVPIPKLPQDVVKAGIDAAGKVAGAVGDAAEAVGDGAATIGSEVIDTAEGTAKEIEAMVNASFGSIGNLAKSVAEEVNSTLKNTLDEMFKVPDLGGLGALFTEGGIKDFTGKIVDTVPLSTFTKLLDAVPRIDESGPSGLNLCLDSFRNLFTQLRAVIAKFDMERLGDNLESLEGMLDGHCQTIANAGEEVMGLLKVPAGYLDFDKFATTINRESKCIEDALNSPSSQDSGKPLWVKIVCGSLILLRDFLASLAEIFYWIASISPSTVKIGVSGGGSVAVVVQGTSEVDIFSFGPFIFGGIAMLSGVTGRLVGTINDEFLLMTS
ncbi:MAG: hypothetical protein O7G85_12740 [Planctomycetota bacterium]|nr:hypothetical protein [Planctomycetota bacterium]